MKEIERKFVINRYDILIKYAIKNIVIEQCYIKITPYEEIRIRRIIDGDNNRYIMTTKYGNGIEREEKEEEIDREIYYELKGHMLHKNPILKRRYILPNDYPNIIKEIIIDDYENVTTECHLHPTNYFKEKIMEIEYLEYPEFVPDELKQFIEKEVTHEPDYKNKNIAMKYFNR